MARKTITWTPRDLIILTSVGTSCLCLIILILGVVFGVLTRKIPVEALGSIQGVSVGSGLLGFGLVLFMIIKVSISTGGNHGDSD
jgi:hypothetical protein